MVGWVGKRPRLLSVGWCGGFWGPVLRFDGVLLEKAVMSSGMFFFGGLWVAGKFGSVEHRVADMLNFFCASPKSCFPKATRDWMAHVYSLQGGPLSIINGVTTPISRVK